MRRYGIILMVAVLAYLVTSGCISPELETGTYRASEIRDTLTLKDDGTFIDKGEYAYGGTYTVSGGVLELHYEVMGIIAQYNIINSTAFTGYKDYIFMRS